MGTCFTTLVPRYESPPTRGWFSVTLDIRTSPQPFRLGRNPSKLRKHFDRLSWRSTRRCRTNVPFLRALLVKPHQNGSSLEVKRWRWEWREVIANKNVNRTKQEWLKSVSSLVRKSWSRNGTDAPDRNRDQPRTDWVQKTLYESGASFLPPSCSLARPPFTHDMLHGLSRGAGSNSLFPFTRIVFVSRENNLIGREKGTEGGNVRISVILRKVGMA